MFQKFRILPLLILVAAAMVTLKVGTIWQDIVGLNASIEALPAQAAEENSAAGGGDAEKPAEDANTAGENMADGKETPETPTAAPEMTDNSFDPRELSQSEIRLLQALSDRRKALDGRENSLNQREALLKAAEQRLEDKQSELVTMREEVKGLLGQLDEEESKRINSLVKLYENMKPKDAARILNDLELNVLMSVVQRMNVRRLAPVLAAMDADKARAVTRSLAQREKAENTATGRMQDSIAERR
jgi:flagellar motility protein MotE (MotC chaperone)